MMREIYASLDVGNFEIKLVVGEIVHTNINILYVGVSPSEGMANNQVTDEFRVSNVIRKLVKEAETTLHGTIKSVVLNVPTNHPRLYQSEGSTFTSVDSKVIKNEDLRKALNNSMNFELAKDEAVLTAVPITYKYGTTKTTAIPLGKAADFIAIQSLVISTKKRAFYSIARCVENAGLEILDVCINAYSGAKEVFDDEYLNNGAILVDIGYQISSISYFADGYLKFFNAIPFGSDHVTQRIQNELSIPYTKAESYKIKYGTCLEERADLDVLHTKLGNDGSQDFTQKDLAKIINEETSRLFQMIKQQLMIINDGRNDEIVIIGGGGELDGIEVIAEEALGCAVRVYRPHTIGARKVSLVSNLGLLYYLVDRMKIIGKQAPSLVLPDISNTMSIRLKGLTRTNQSKAGYTGKINKILDTLLTGNDEDEE